MPSHEQLRLSGSFSARAKRCTLAAGLLIAYGTLQCSVGSREVVPVQPTETSVTAAGGAAGSVALLHAPSTTIKTATLEPTPANAVGAETAPHLPGYANLDPNDDLVEGPPENIPDCEERLIKAGIKFRTASLPVIKKGRLTCGADQVVQYLHGPGTIRIYPYPLVTCQLALALGRLEEVANRTAKELLSTEVVAITQGGTYNCRSMARFKIISEHSFANAIDIFGFKLKDGRSVPVLGYFGDPKKPASSPEARFLRLLANRLFDEQVCSVVVTRFYDELHRNHIHCDMARYHVDGSR